MADHLNVESSTIRGCATRRFTTTAGRDAQPPRRMDIAWIICRLISWHDRVSPSLLQLAILAKLTCAQPVVSLNINARAVATSVR